MMTTPTQTSSVANRHQFRSVGLFAALAISTLALTGCSSTEDKVYKAFRCAKVASLLGNDAAAKRAMSKVTIEMEKLTTSASPDYIGRRRCCINRPEADLPQTPDAAMPRPLSGACPVR